VPKDVKASIHGTTPGSPERFEAARKIMEWFRGEQTDMFFAPAAPSGPNVEAPTPAAGTPEAYALWRKTAEGVEFWDALKRTGLEAFNAGDKRFSTRTFLARYRDDFKVKINDHFSPWLATDLIAAIPQLADIVEQRVRKKSEV
jgi:hypothetical protein